MYNGWNSTNCGDKLNLLSWEPPGHSKESRKNNNKQYITIEKNEIYIYMGKYILVYIRVCVCVYDEKVEV